MRRFLGYLLLLAIVGTGWLAYSQSPEVRSRVDAALGRTTGPQPGKVRALPAAPVRLATTTRRNVPIYLEGVGNVQARSTIAIKARIDGQLMEAVVADGQMVRAGDLLFRLDARPLEAQLRQAEANVARDRANLEKALADERRFESLAQKGISPKTKLEEAETSVAALRAAIRASEAAVEIAGLNLEYASIRAPIDGRVGSVLLSPGNMVKANDTQPIMVLTEVRPINVAFALPEQYVGELRARLAGSEPLVVEAIAQGDDEASETGELFFVNNVVDTATGTIMVMARFANADERLVPGLFVKARVRMTTLPGVVVAPSRGIQINQQGHYVWVVRSDMTAELRPVTIGAEVGQETVISQGLDEGEAIVVDGQLRLFPDAKVAPIDALPRSATAKRPS